MPAFFRGALLVARRNSTFATMTAFRTSVDIANRALQHCGANLIDTTQGLAEDSNRAQQVAACYDKLRRAELRRNTWAFAIRRTVLRAMDATTMFLSPAVWSASTTYFVGSIVSDAENGLWFSNSPNNLNNDPQNTPVWTQYFGPMAVSLYDATLSYYSDELVYTTAGDGTYRVFLSRIDANSDNPATATAWDATTTFYKNQVVTRTAVAYMSLIDFNINQDPALAPALWSSGTTYAAGTKVGASDGVIYQSIGSGNLGNDPTTDAGAHWTNTGVLNPWTTVFVGGSGSANWLEIGGAEFPTGVAIVPPNIVYPLGSGPSSQQSTANVFRLPANYLRRANQNPNANGVYALGGPSGISEDDWAMEGPFIVSRQTGPIILRFVGDFSDVTAMDDMFCEGFALRIGMEVCEPLTQSGDKLKTIASLYKQFMTEARTVNGIETGPEESPEDPYITVRY